MSRQIGELARHTGVYGVGTVVGGIARAALIPIIARWVPAEEYGKASVVLIFITLLGIVSEVGLSSSLIKFVNEAPDEDERRKVVSTILVASLTLAAGIAVVCVFLAGRLSGILLGSDEYRSLMLIGIAGGFGNAVLQVGLAFERAHARSRRYVAYTLAKGGLALALSITLVVALRRGAVGLLVGTALPPVAVGLVIYGRLLGRYATGVSRRVLSSILEFGTPLVPMNVAMWVLAYSDIYLLRRLTGGGRALSEVGLYQYAHEICLVLVLPITSLNLAWPHFIFSNHSKPGANEMFSRAHLYFAFLLVEVGFLLALFARPVIAFVGSAQYAGSAGVVPILAGSLVFYGFSIVFSSGLYVVGKTRVLAVVVASCAALNVVLNVLLIPGLGKQGAALATLATNIVMAVAILVFSQRQYRIPFRLPGTLGATLLAGAVVAGLAYLDRSRVPHVGVVRVAAACVFSVVLPRILGMTWGEVGRGIHAVASFLNPRPQNAP